jgi:prepilin-type processing-associated H-X9-DG protein
MMRVFHTLTATGSGGQPANPRATIYRLKEGVERFMITDINNPAGSAQAQSSMAIMLDAISAGTWQNGDTAGTIVFNHIPGGSNVLFFDGHVEFLKYTAQTPPSSNGKFPVTPFVAHALSRTTAPGKPFNYTVL